MTRLAAIALTVALAMPLAAQQSEPDPPMTPERVVQIVRALDPDAQPAGAGIEFTVADLPVLLIMDAAADRLRVMVPVRSADTLSPEELMRMMQANFDSALDARYAVARGRVWSVYLHPLASLERNQLIEGIGQVVNTAASYGTLYSSGALQFGAGDSGALQRELIDDLLQRGEPL